MNTHNKALSAGNTSNPEKDDRAMRGAQLKAAMVAALDRQQMSVSGLARDAHVQRGDIYRWWRGESRPTRNSLARIAAALDVEPDALRHALGEPVHAESADPVAQAINALVDRLDRLEADQAEGFDAVLKAIAAAAGAPAPTGTSTGSGRAARAGTAR